MKINIVRYEQDASKKFCIEKLQLQIDLNGENFVLLQISTKHCKIVTRFFAPHLQAQSNRVIFGK